MSKSQKKRVYTPKLRAIMMRDKRTRKLVTRTQQRLKAIKESQE